MRAKPELYRVGRGEQGVLLVEPYKSEILPYWRFKTVAIARRSASKIADLFARYEETGDFVGMDMARKFLQMGYTRSRRYANRAGGRKYDRSGKVLPFSKDPLKAAAAQVFFKAWKKVEGNENYRALRTEHRKRYG